MGLRTYLRFLKSSLLGTEHRYREKSHSQIYDDIYLTGAWGTNEAGASTSGPGSHTDDVVLPYVQTVSDFLKTLVPSKVVDLGCGDFNVGKQLAQYCETVVACDVSEVILERNRSIFSHLKNCEFRHLDLTIDNLPKGDVAIVRQVLQHLSNSSIQRFVQHVNQHKPFRYMLITEHVPLKDKYKYNIDKPAGANIRLGIGSGIVLHEAPFHLSYRSKQNLLSVRSDFGREKAEISTILYVLW